MPATIRTVLLTLAALAATGFTGLAQAQMGPEPPPTGGLVNQVAGPLGLFGDDGPGWFYFGVNGADRGLGYIGSYMTLGGFIPYAEDDLGGLWAADLRGHLSVNGGFFSNVGAVRKQFIGGTLLGLGVYWDYDGDMNQYPVWGVPGTEVFGQFGHAYNQVGVSGEWLTDYGNLRSNGYIPVGTTAYTRGAPGSPFSGNYLLCQNGLDTALGGADLEVGVYVPALADWAGMISVGGYALGNARYQWEQGSQLGQDLVPWFGGVYTRLDMTFLENWDFSLQANNDNFFDWTGFARLTYRMGGSRRRNVPDQVEQPMMRNEHIVRAHQTPIVAVNPATNQPWNVIHVDRTAVVGGNGTVEAPVTQLVFAQNLATQPYDIVYVYQGNSATNPGNRYESSWQFQTDNQILVGQGSTLELNTLSCGFRQFFNQPTGARPVLTSSGTAITLRNGAVVDHFRIEDSPIGIAADGAVTGTVTVNDVQLVGTGTVGDQGVVLSGVAAGATVNLFNMQVENMDRGLLIDGGAADVVFQGLIENSDSPSPSLEIRNTTGGNITLNETLDFLETPTARNADFSVAYGIVDIDSRATAAVVIDSTTDTTINIGKVRLTTPTQTGVSLSSNQNGSLNFFDLLVTGAADQAFQTTGNDAASLVSVSGSSRLSSTSNTLPVFESNDNATLNIELVSLVSDVPSANPAADAIRLTGGSSGSLTIESEFLVRNPTPPPPLLPGTVADDVENTTTGPVVVTVPTP